MGQVGNADARLVGIKEAADARRVLCQRRGGGHCGRRKDSTSEGGVPVGGATNNDDCLRTDEDAARRSQRNHDGTTVEDAAVLRMHMQDADEGRVGVPMEQDQPHH